MPDSARFSDTIAHAGGAPPRAIAPETAPARMIAGEAAARAALRAALLQNDHTALAAGMIEHGGDATDGAFGDGYLDVLARAALAGARAVLPPELVEPPPSVTGGE